jgi:hypothetical protein
MRWLICTISLGFAGQQIRQGSVLGTFCASSSMLMYFYQLFGTRRSLGPSPCANISIEVLGFADVTDRVADFTSIGLCCVVLMVEYIFELIFK